MVRNTPQVLVYDRAHYTHVLLAAGSTFEDYLVIEVRGIGVTMESRQERFTRSARFKEARDGCLLGSRS